MKYQTSSVADKKATHVPTTVSEEVLVEAGLGDEIPDIECTTQQFHDILAESFPKLFGAGGFELLQCIAYTSILEPISASVAKSPKLLKRVVGNSRVYI